MCLRKRARARVRAWVGVCVCVCVCVMEDKKKKNSITRIIQFLASLVVSDLTFQPSIMFARKASKKRS